MSIISRIVAVPYRMAPSLSEAQFSSPPLTLCKEGSRERLEKEVVLRTRDDWYVEAKPVANALYKAASLLADGNPKCFTLDGDSLSCCSGDAVLLTDVRASWAFIHRHVLDDFAVLNGVTSELDMISFAFPSGWSPAEKVGKSLLEVHAPIPDAKLLQAASAHLAALVSKDKLYERTVWTLKPTGDLDYHPTTAPAVPFHNVYFRWESQAFVPLGDGRSLFIDATRAFPLELMAESRDEIELIIASISSMSREVKAYKGLDDPTLMPFLEGFLS